MCELNGVSTWSYGMVQDVDSTWLQSEYSRSTTEVAGETVHVNILDLNWGCASNFRGCVHLILWDGSNCWLNLFAKWIIKKHYRRRMEDCSLHTDISWRRYVQVSLKAVCTWSCVMVHVHTALSLKKRYP